MTSYKLLLTFLAVSLVGCASYEGAYEPSCTAYEGDTLILADGRFEWRRFTDERRVDAAGELIEPFPGFPKSGTYRISEKRLQLVTDTDERLQDWFFVDSDGQRYLLDGAQHKAFLEAGGLPDCPLRFSSSEAR